jgi:hypothetical protein
MVWLRCDITPAQQASQTFRLTTGRDVHNPCATCFGLPDDLIDEAHCQCVALLYGRWPKDPKHEVVSVEITY